MRIEYREVLKASKKPDNFWFWFYYRLASLIAYFAIRFNIPANLITLSALSINTSTVAFFLGQYEGGGNTILWTYFLFNLAHVFDCADGQVARATKTCSEAGRWLDISSDMFKLIFVGVVFSYIYSYSAPYETERLHFILSIAVLILGPLVNALFLLYAPQIGPVRNQVLHSIFTDPNLSLIVKCRKILASNIGEYGNYLLILLICFFNRALGIQVAVAYSSLFFVFGIIRLFRVYFILKMKQSQ